MKPIAKALNKKKAKKFDYESHLMKHQYREAKKRGDEVDNYGYGGSSDKHSTSVYSSTLGGGLTSRVDHKTKKVTHDWD